MSWDVNSENGTIKITKNDTPTFKINVNIKNNETNELMEYTPGDGDEIIFAIKMERDDDNPLVVIPIDNDTMSVTFPPHWADGMSLGKYWYEVSLNNGDYHETFIESRRLIIVMEIYGG